MSYRTFYAYTREPFCSDLDLKDILQTQELLAVKERFDYALRIGAMALVTGDIGSGKSTALRYAIGQLHPSEYVTFSITASSGSILELYRQILSELGIPSAGTSRTILTQTIRREIQELILGKKMKVALIIDEASRLGRAQAGEDRDAQTRGGSGGVQDGGCARGGQCRARRHPGPRVSRQRDQFRGRNRGRPPRQDVPLEPHALRPGGLHLGRACLARMARVLSSRTAVVTP